MVRVPHQVRKMDRPTVSKSLAATLTPTVSRGLFSLKIWARNCAARCDVSQATSFESNKKLEG